MNNEAFKNKVKKSLEDAGILIANDESIFSVDKIIRDETDESLMLVSPKQDIWVWLGAMMQDKDIDDGIEKFKQSLTASVQDDANRGLKVNPSISVTDFLEGVAKMFGGKAPTENLATAKFTDLVTMAMTPVNA
jgi:hypothetical protein